MPRRNSGPHLRFLYKRRCYYITWTERGRSRSAARAQQIANKLKSRSPNSSTSEPAALAHVIPLKR